MQIGVRARDLGRLIVRYPWLLSETAQNNVDELVEFLISVKVLHHHTLPHHFVPRSCFTQLATLLVLILFPEYSLIYECKFMTTKFLGLIMLRNY